MDVSSIENPAPQPPGPPARRRWRPWKWIAVLLVVLIALVALAPALATGFLTRRVQADMSEALGTEVRVQSLSFSWFSGLTVEGLEIRNAKGFDQTHPFLAFRSLRGDVSLVRLLGGRFDLSGTLDGLVIHVDQGADGRSNVEALFGTLPQVGEGEVKVSMSVKQDEQPFDLAILRLDLELVDGLMELRRAGALLESVRKLNCSIQKEFGTQVVRVDVDAQLHRPSQPSDPGRVAIAADVNTETQVVESHITASGLDLSRYQALVSAFLEPGALTALEGIVNGTIQAKATGRQGEQRLFLEGNLAVEAPRISGALFGGMDIVAPKWTLAPNMTVELGKPGAVPTVIADRFSVDLGFMVVRGLTGDELQRTLNGKTGLGLGYTVDLDQLAEFGGPMPEILKRAGGRLQGRLALPIEGGKMPDLGKLQELVTAEAELSAQRISVAGFEVASLSSTVTVKDGDFDLRTTSGTLLNAGTFDLSLQADLERIDRLPFQFDLKWQGGKVGGDTASWLRYAVPLLAGLQHGAAFQGGIDLALRLEGPALKTGEETWLQLLDKWNGSGDLSINGATVKPSEALNGLLSALGSDGTLALDRFAGAFTLAQGAVTAKAMEWQSKGQKYGLQGTTRLDGTMDWGIDLTAMLLQHKDGAKIAAALGDKKILAGLKGTLAAPTLAMPDVASLLPGLLQGAAQDLLEGNTDAIRKGLEGLLGGRRKN